MLYVYVLILHEIQEEQLLFFSKITLLQSLIILIQFFFSHDKNDND